MNADLTVLDDPLGVIRSKPEMYVGSGDRGASLVASLLSDALSLGATETSCVRRDDWYVVSADVDWLTATCRFQFPVPELFRRIVPLPEFGANAMRAEALVAAFAEAVFIATPGAEELIAGRTPPAEVREAMLPIGALRSVAFSLGLTSAHERSHQS